MAPFLMSLAGMDDGYVDHTWSNYRPGFLLCRHPGLVPGSILSFSNIHLLTELNYLGHIAERLDKQ